MIRDDRIMEMRKNPNLPIFWDRKIKKVKYISKDDYITKDRINFVSGAISNNSSVLDIGFGYGFLEKELKKSKCVLRLVGIDISMEASKRAKKIFGWEFLLSRSSNLPFSNNCFDYVCLLEVLEHLYEDESRLSLLEAKRVLKRNGRLIVSVPLFDKVFPAHPSGHVRLYKPNTLLDELNENGFQATDLKYLYAFSSYYEIKNFVNKIFKIKQPNDLIVVARKK